MQSILKVACADPKTVRAKHHEISVRYAWNAYKRNGEISAAHRMTLTRMRELERLFTARHGAKCLPDDDAGREYLEIAAHHIAHLCGEVEQHLLAWSRMWAPWLLPDEAKELARRVTAKPRRWKAAALGDELNLTPEERAASNITTFRPAGWSKTDIDNANKERRRIREKERRKRIAAAEGRILRARPGRPRKPPLMSWRAKENQCGTDISAQQGSLNAGHEFSVHAEPSGTTAAPKQVSALRPAETTTAQASGTAAPLEATNVTPLRPPTPSEPTSSDRPMETITEQTEWKEAA